MSFAVRMGLRTVKGLRTDEGERIEAAGRERPFASLRDFRDRTRISERSLEKLAEAGFFEPFHSSRRQALWQAHGVVAEGESRELQVLEEDEAADPPVGPPATVGGAGEPPDRSLSDADAPPSFEDLSDLDEIAWDYRTTDHSTRGHILEPLRPKLESMGLPDAATLSRMEHGARARYAGVVICRQRPGTASGVVFMTLEDESGFVNLVVWSDVFDRYAVLARSLSLLGVTGRIQSSDGVTHLIVKEFWEPELELKPDRRSRDFH